jgi:hypothetical protein
MNYERFGRLNSKKLNEYLYENSPLYDMAKLFPYLPTRKTAMDRRHTISSFKTMMKKYRYCYKLYSDCIAKIKMKGKREYDICPYIDNNVYVFTNIAHTKIDTSDFQVIYDRDAIIKLKTSDDLQKDADIISNAIISMEQRKFPKEVIKNLKTLLSVFNTLPLSFDAIPSEYQSSITPSIFEEFRLRCLLEDTNIYKINNNYCDDVMLSKQQTKSHFTIQDYSLLKEIEKYYPMVDLLQDIKVDLEKLDHYEYYGLKALQQYETFKEYSKLEEYIDDIKKYTNILDIYKIKCNDLDTIYTSYHFLNNPYSKEYRALFKKYRATLSKWQTQEIFRKYKKEYSKIEQTLNTLFSSIDKMEDVLKRLDTIKIEYKETLATNGLPNNGMGYLEQFDDEDNYHINPQTGELDIMAEFRHEEEVQIELDRIHDNDEYKYQMDRDKEYEEFLKEELKKDLEKYNQLSGKNLTLKEYEELEYCYSMYEDEFFEIYDTYGYEFERDLVYEQIQEEKRIQYEARRKIYFNDKDTKEDEEDVISDTNDETSNPAF